MGLMNIGDQRIANRDVVREIALLREDSQLRHDEETAWRKEMLEQAKQQTHLLGLICAAMDHTARRQ